MKPEEQKRNLAQKVFTRENLYRLVLLLFGFSIFPGIVFLIGKLFITSSDALSDSYSKFYGSLLDLGTSGIVSWSIACAPYFVYDV